jgi:hypothetical protein
VKEKVKRTLSEDFHSFAKYSFHPLSIDPANFSFNIARTLLTAFAGTRTPVITVCLEAKRSLTEILLALSIPGLTIELSREAFDDAVQASKVDQTEEGEQNPFTTLVFGDGAIS